MIAAFELQGLVRTEVIDLLRELATDRETAIFYSTEQNGDVGPPHIGLLALVGLALLSFLPAVRAYGSRNAYVV